MTTALQILNRATEITGYKDPSETLSGDDAAQFLAVLNSLVDSWNTSRLYVVATATVSASVSASPVSIGASQTLNTTRPIRVEGGWIRQDGIDYELDWITSAEYDAIQNKSLTSSIPTRAFYSPGLPNGSVYLWPAPSGTVSLHVRVMAQLSAFADLATDYTLAPGYKRALELSLAEEIHPNRITPKIERQAFGARKAIKTVNHEPLQLEHCGVPHYERFNILTGQ
jgi:hypothetical protein